MGAVFVELGGGEVDGDFFGGEVEEGIGDGAADALFGLFDGFVGHTYDIEVGEAFVGVAFDFYNVAVVSCGDSGDNFANHGGNYMVMGVDFKALV